MNKNIFLSSAYTHGNQEENVLRQIKAFHHLRDKGWTPITPLLSHYLDLYQNRPYEDWIKWCFDMIDVSIALCRLDMHIPSSGADREEDRALKRKLFVFHEARTVPHWDDFYKENKLFLCHRNGIPMNAL